jgi:hypothetical protein
MKKYDFITKEILIEKYKELPIYKIAEEFGCSFTAVRNKLSKYGIPIKIVSEQRIKKYNFITKELLYDLYWNENKSLAKVAEYFKCSVYIILKKMKEYNIKIRTLKKAAIGHIPWNKGKKCPQLAGENNPNYKNGKTHNNKCIDCGKIIHRKSIRCNRCMGINRRKLGLFNGRFSSQWEGGLTSLHRLIRNSFDFETWRNNILKRDNYTCQDCGKQGGDLEAHHIKTFSEILSNFLKEYDQFSPIEDKETLVRLALKYEPFWDINNGKTVCRKCHMKIHKYLISIKV